MTSDRQHSQSAAGVIGGIALIVLGVLFLLNEFLRIDIFSSLWPLFVILFGVAFFVGMVLGGRQAGGMAIPGSMFVILGLILLAQNSFGAWASWSYAWALFAPTGVGVGIVIQSWWSDKPELKREGYKVVGIGLLLFLIFGSVFEMLLNITGLSGFGNLAWPLVLIVLGLVLLFGRLVNLSHLVDLLPPHKTHGGLPIQPASHS